MHRLPPPAARIRVPTLIVALCALLACMPAAASADSWTNTDSMSARRVSFTATLLADGQVLAAGGSTDNAVDPLATSERWDPATGQWSGAATFSQGRAEQAAGLLPDGRVLMTGGEANQTPLTSALAFDPGSNAWRSVASMPSAHTRHTQVTLQDGRVLVIGGYETRDDLVRDGASSLVELYDPTLNAWTIGATMPYYMATGTTTLLQDGSVLVAGGASSNTNRNVALRYFPATNRWRTAGSFTDARRYQVAALLPNGKVLVAGGFGDRDALRSAVLYDPATNAWTDVAPMATARVGATATTLPNGKVLVAGGRSPDIFSVTATAELFDPTTNTWSPAASMATPRSDHTATLLADGRVLVAGGSPGIALVTDSAEIYTPDGWPFPRGGGGGSDGGGGGTGGGSGAGTPAISSLVLSATRFRAAGSGPSVTAARRKAPIGTTISYRDSAAATATFTVQRPAAGRRAAGRCVKPTRANRSHRRCTRWVTVGRFRHADAAGANALRFSGRIRGHKLRPGRYRLSLSARIGSGTPSAARRVGFRIVG